MRSPFRRRRRRRRGRPATPSQQPEVIDWPQDGTGKSLMSSLRGDAQSGTGSGAGMFADLQAAFGGAGKQIQLEEQEKEKTRRHELHTEAPPRDDLESGTIRITRPPSDEDDD